MNKRKNVEELKISNKAEWIFFTSSVYGNKELEEETTALLKDSKENSVMCSKE